MNYYLNLRELIIFKNLDLIVFTTMKMIKKILTKYDINLFIIFHIPFKIIKNIKFIYLNLFLCFFFIYGWNILFILYYSTFLIFYYLFYLKILMLSLWFLFVSISKIPKIILKSF